METRIKWLHNTISYWVTAIIIIIIIIIINEFHRDASLAKTSGPLCVTCYTSVNATVAGCVHCLMIYGTVLSSVRAWMPPVTTVMWSPGAACSRLLLRQRGRHDCRWSCATIVEHATTVTMQIADAYVTQCRRPVVAHCRGSVVLCRSYNDALERQGGSWFALQCTSSGALEEEETHAHSSLPSTRGGRQN